MEDGPQYQTPTEAQRILRELVNDERLEFPQELHRFVGGVNFTGITTPILPIPWKMGECMAAIKGLEGVFAALIASERFDKEVQAGEITVDCAHAALFTFSSLGLTTLDGKNPMIVSNLNHVRNWDFHGALSFRYSSLVSNIYQTKDGRFFHTHMGLNPEPSQKYIGVDPSRTDITDEEEILKIYGDAVSKHDAAELDRLCNDVYKQSGTICYTPEEFTQTEQGKAIADIPLYELHTRSEPSARPPCGWPKATSNKALSGFKVLEFTRIIAGPAIGRGLAEHGATVLRVTCETLPDYHGFHLDLGQGKLNTFLDLKTEAGKTRLRELIAEADVFIDGYRPDVLERLGFGPSEVTGLISWRKHGIVYVRENCYGWHGPWSSRSGWQQISDCFTGVSWGFGMAQGLDEPVVPVFPNSDYGTGVAGIVGVMHALYLRSKEDGGSYSVDLSLSYYNVWMASQGLLPHNVWEQVRSHAIRHNDDMGRSLPRLIPEIFKRHAELITRGDLWQTIDAPSFGGTIRTITPVVRFTGGLGIGCERPPVQNGTHEPVWPREEKA